MIKNNYDLIFILVFAFILDLIFGEPPKYLHPVVLIGNIIIFLENKIKFVNEKVKGISIVLITLLFSYLLYFIVSRISNTCYFTYFVTILIQAYFLKCTFSLRYMVLPAIQMYSTLKSITFVSQNNFQKLNIYVSRNTTNLTRGQIISCIIESISENYVDSILSPLFYYFIFGYYGLLGAYLFKSINTLDSMIGYKTKKYINIGYCSAKLDDFLNYIPSRLSLFFILLGASIALLKYNSLHPLNGIKTALKDHFKTPSPNSGWPMSMVAGILCIKLEKKDVYVLASKFDYPSSNDILKMCIIFILTSIITLFIFVILIFYLID